MCLVGLRIEGVNHIFKIEYDETPYGEALEAIRRLLASVDIIVVFNGKFDLNWLARYGIQLPAHVRVFDCQLAEFIVDHQRSPFPSLDGCLAKYNLGAKSDVVEREYWSKGIDTTEIPYDIISQYLEVDLERTDSLYSTLLQVVSTGGFTQLCRLHMQDLRVLEEMEYNGLLFDWNNLASTAAATEQELEEIKNVILGFVPSAFRERFNYSSGDHLSSLLYGGCIRVSVGVPYQHTFKGGKNAGTTVTRYKWHEESCEFPRLVDPPEGSALKKEGFFSVDEETLLQLKKPKELVNALLKRAELEKLLGTYYKGIPAQCEKYDWQDGYVHGTFNQCRVVTGRLSSEKPNLQNMPDILMKYIKSRYG